MSLFSLYSHTPPSFLLLLPPVHKFRRRPRYLEFFVHLCHKAVEEGQYSSVVVWSEEALSWLRRRNEVLVQAKVPTLTRKEPATLTGDQTRYAHAVVKYTEKPKVRSPLVYTYFGVIIDFFLPSLSSPLLPSPFLSSPLLPSPPLSPYILQSHIMRHHSQLAVKPPPDSHHRVLSPHQTSQPKDAQALVPTGDTGRRIKRESSKSVLTTGLVATVTKDDLIGKV